MLLDGWIGVVLEATCKVGCVDAQQATTSHFQFTFCLLVAGKPLIGWKDVVHDPFEVLNLKKAKTDDLVKGVEDDDHNAQLQARVLLSKAVPTRGPDIC